jgi:hypothetical protein
MIRPETRSSPPREAHLAGAAARRIEVSVGELSLPGQSPRSAERIAAAFRLELARSLVSVDLSKGSRRDGSIVERFAMHATERPEATGRRLARVVAGIVAGRDDETHRDE